MTGGQRYLVNVTVFFFLTMAAIFLSELIPHPKEIYGFIFAVCMIPAVIFMNIRLPTDDVSVRGAVVATIILGVYMTSLWWLLEEKMSVPRSYTYWLIFGSWMLFVNIRRVMKKRAQQQHSSDPDKPGR